MRQLIINAIIEKLPAVGYNSMRWESVAKFMCSMQKGDPDSRKFRQGLKTYQILENDFESFTDREVLAFYELVIRRWYICM